MKKAFSLIICFSFATMVMSAGEPENIRIYVFGAAGISFPNEIVIAAIPSVYEINAKLKPAFHWAGGLGFSVSKNLRIEAETALAASSIDDSRRSAEQIIGSTFLRADGRVRSFRVLLTAWYDVPFGEAWTLSLGGGFGLDHVRLSHIVQWTEAVVPNPVPMESEVADDSGWTPGYHLGAALSCRLSPRLFLELGGRYLGAADAKFTNMYGAEFSTAWSALETRFVLRFGF